MVLSKISKEVTYKELNQLDLEDVEHQSALYIAELLDNEYVIALGNVRTEHTEKGIVYYPIYLVSAKKRIKAKIGIFEVAASKSLSIVDDDGDIDLNKLDDPILYSFVTSTFLETNGSHGTELESHGTELESHGTELESPPGKTQVKPIIETEKEKGVVDVIESDSESDSDDDTATLKKGQNEKRNDDAKNDDAKNATDGNNKKILLEDVFTKENPLPSIKSWPSESEADAKQMRDMYKKNKSIQDNWINTFMKNKEYKIFSNESGSDSLFVAIRDAFFQIGHNTTITKLRKFLSQQVTLELYDNYKTVFDNLEFERSSVHEEIGRLQKVNGELKKQSDKTKSATQQKEILNEAVKVKQDYLTQTLQKKGADEILSEMDFMKHVKNVDELQLYVQTTNFWANAWATSMMEFLLSIKIILMENTNDANSVILCSEENDDLNSNKDQKFEPTYYILMSATKKEANTHFELVSYKDKKIFKFAELPYDMKTKIILSCVENNEKSQYAKISDFRQFRHELGVTEKTSSDDDLEGANNSLLFDPHISLSFHATSASDKKAGYVNADHVTYSRRNEFATLNSFPNWRQRLDDAWSEKPFTTRDGKRWNSVSHYLMAVPFKMSYPAVYEEFSDDSKSDISKDLAKAKRSLEKGTKREGVVKEEGKHYNTFKKTTALDELTVESFRKEALKSKFDPKTEMGRLLKSTNMAKLENYRRGKEPYIDHPLMEIRHENNNA